MFRLFQKAGCFFLSTSKTALIHSSFTFVILFLGSSFSVFGQLNVPCSLIPSSRYYDFNMFLDSVSTPSIGSSYSLGDTIKIHFQGAFNTLAYGYLPEQMGVFTTANIPGLTRVDTGQNTTNMHFVRFDSINNTNVYHLDTLATHCSDSRVYVLSDTMAFNQGNTLFIVRGQEIALPNQPLQRKGYDVHPDYNSVQTDIKQPHPFSYLLCNCNSHLSPLCDVTMSFEDTVCNITSAPYYGSSHCTYINRGENTVQIVSECSWNYADDWRPFLPSGIFSFHAPWRSVINGVAHMSHTGSTLYTDPGDSYSFNSQFEIFNFNTDRDLIVHFQFRITDVNDPTDVVVHNLYDTIYTCALTLGISSVNEMPVRVYPNPGSGAFHIDFGQDGVYQIHMTDLAGRDVFQQEYHGSHYHFNPPSTAMVSGTYLITYTNKLTGAKGQTKVILTP